MGVLFVGSIHFKTKLSLSLLLRHTNTLHVVAVCLDTGVTAACRGSPLTSTRVEMLIVAAAQWVGDGEKQQREAPPAYHKYDMNDNVQMAACHTGRKSLFNEIWNPKRL